MNSNSLENLYEFLSNLLNEPIEKIKKYSHNIENEPNLMFVSCYEKGINDRGGISLIIDINSLEYLYVPSYMNYDEAIEKFKQGARNNG